MQKVDFETSLGTVPLWGRFDRFAPERPLLLVIRGAFPDPDHLHGLTEGLPHADVAFVHLPGMHTPHFKEPSVSAFAVAFDEVLAMAFGVRRVNVLGLSMGGVVALALRHPRLRSIIATDAPLSTAGLWPLRELLLSQADSDPGMAAWVWGLFGQGRERSENRDYSDLLEGLQTPTRMLIGHEPLEPQRSVSRLPSLVSAADRALYLAHPKVGVSLIGDAGHNIPRDGQRAMFDIIERWVTH